MNDVELCREPLFNRVLLRLTTEHMKESKKDVRERYEEYHLNVFAELHALPGTLLPRTLIPQDDKPFPDFLFQADGRIVGIEHTDLKNVDKAEVMGRQRRISQKAVHEIKRLNWPLLQVRILFGPSFAATTDDAVLVSAIVETIKENEKDIAATKYGNSIKLKLSSPIAGVKSIWARSGRASGKVWLDDHRWEVIEGGFVTFTLHEELQYRIAEKSKRIGDYLAKCNECWLLVVADRRKRDQMFAVTEEIGEHTFTSAFAKTFFLEIAEKDLIELRTQPAS